MSSLFYTLDSALTFDPSGAALPGDPTAPDTHWSFTPASHNLDILDDDLVQGYTAPDSRSSRSDQALNSLYPPPSDPWNEFAQPEMSPASDDDYPPAFNPWPGHCPSPNLEPSPSSSDTHDTQDRSWQQVGNIWQDHDEARSHLPSVNAPYEYTVYPDPNANFDDTRYPSLSAESTHAPSITAFDFGYDHSYVGLWQEHDVHPQDNLDSPSNSSVQTASAVPSHPVVPQPRNMLDELTRFVAPPAFLNAVAPTSPVWSDCPTRDRTVATAAATADAAATAATRNRVRQRRLATGLRDDTALPRVKKSAKHPLEPRLSRRREQKRSAHRRAQVRVRDAFDGDESDTTVRASRSDNEGDDHKNPSAHAVEDAYVSSLLAHIDGVPAITLRLRPVNIVRVVERHPVRQLFIDSDIDDDYGCTINVWDSANRFRMFIRCTPLAVTMLRQRGLFQTVRGFTLADKLPSTYYRAMKGLTLPSVEHILVRVSGQAHAAFWSQADFMLLAPSLRVLTFAAYAHVVLPRAKYDNMLTRVVAFAGPVTSNFLKVEVPGVTDLID